MLAHGLLVFRRQIWITIANNFPKAYLSNFFWHQFFVKQAALNARFIVHKTGDYFVQILTTNALRLFTFWLTQAFNFHMKLTRLLVNAHITLIGLITFFAIIKARLRAASGGFRGKLKRSEERRVGNEYRSR